MKTKLTLLLAALFAASGIHAQQTTSSSTLTPSVRDNPGLLGMAYGELGLSLERIRGAPDPAYSAGVALNRPVARGVDLGLGYDYWWYDYATTANAHDERSRYHLLGAEAKFYRPTRGAKPFFTAMLGYQWSKGSYSGYVVNPPDSTTTVTTPPGGTTTIVTTPPPTTTTTTGTVPPGGTFTGTTTTGDIYGPGTITTTDPNNAGSTSSALTYISTSQSGHRPVWGLGAGFELPLGRLALTPRISYTDTMEAGSDWAYHYGAELHHWFSERTGAFADVTFNEPRLLPSSWSYFAGLRMRF